MNTMYTSAKSVALVSMAMCCVATAAIGGKPDGRYLKPAPPEINKLVTQSVADLAKAYPTSPALARKVQEMVDDYTLDNRNRENNLRLRKELRAIGAPALGTLASLLSDPDKDTRLRAFMLMSGLVQTYGRMKSDYAITERALLAVGLRGLYEADVTMRLAALGRVYTIGFERRHKCAQVVKDALERMEKEDPDDTVRRRARQYRKHLGIIPYEKGEPMP